MKQYKDIDGDSGVAGYDFSENGIWVYFRGGPAYLYTNFSAGSRAISDMKALAEQGDGLNSYIMRFVRTAYAQRGRW